MGEIAKSLDFLTATPEPAGACADKPRALDAIAALIGGAGASAFHHAFRLIGIAEERMAVFERRFPEKAKPLRKAFLALRWLYDPTVPGALYRAHVDELLARTVRGESLDEGTKAEALWAMYKTSLDAPLTAQGQALMEDLFESIMGQHQALGAAVSEPWPGARDELLVQLRRRLRRNRVEE